tara:strand:+ start:830 stop:1630 length:801 start_codon:yes stop_codon:yes gene_type:complete
MHAQHLANLQKPPGLRELAADGIIGSKSRVFLGRILGARWQSIKDDGERQVAAFYQKLAGQELKQDGFWGPNTEFFAEKVLSDYLGRQIVGRKDETEKANKPKKLKSAKVKIWSPTDSQMIRHYGQPGSGLVTFKIPYPVRLAWDLATSVTRVTMHRLAQGPVLMALELIADRYTAADREELHIDRYGGGAYVRKKRGGSTWSAHAFGGAMDWDPDRNRLRETRRTARFARPEYKKFLDSWGEAGFMNLGQAYNFDWMHVQLNPPS